ncbi:MAG: hypothetical protein ACH34X_06170 [Thiolinea sp.]
MHKLVKFNYLAIAILLSGITTAVAAESANKTYLALSQEQGQILWLQTGSQAAINTFNGQTGALEQTVPLKLEPSQLIMGFTPDGFKVAVLEQAGLSIVHRTGKTLRTLAVPNLPQPTSNYQPATALTNAAGTAQLFHDAKAKQLHVIHTGNGKPLATLALPQARLLALGLDATMSKVAYVTQATAGKADLQVYDLFKKTWVKTYSIAAPTAFSQPVVFSQDGKYAALLPQLINLQTEEVSMLRGATGLAVFTTNNQALLFASQQGMQRFELVSKQQQSLDLKLLANCRTTVAEDFSADQQRLALASLCTNDAKTLAVVSFLDAKTGQWQRNLNLAKP